MTTIPLSKEELLSAHNRGVLEGLLLGYGILPLKALESVLEEETFEKENLISRVNMLENEIESLEETIEYLENYIDDMKGYL